MAVGERARGEDDDRVCLKDGDMLLGERVIK